MVYVWDKSNVPQFANYYGDSMLVVDASSEAEAWGLLAKQAPEEYVQLQGDDLRKLYFGADKNGHLLHALWKHCFVDKKSSHGDLYKEWNRGLAEYFVAFLDEKGDMCAATASRPYTLKTGVVLVARASD